MRNRKEFKKSKTKIILCNSMVRNKLENCANVWNPFYQIHIDKIERVQDIFFKYLNYKDNGINENKRYKDMLKFYKTLSLSSRRVGFCINL